MERAERRSSEGPSLLCLRGEDLGALRAQVRALRAGREQPPAPAEAALTPLLTLALISRDSADLGALLEEADARLASGAAIEEPGRLHFQPAPYGAEALVWLFPGQGSQRVGMLRGLREAFPGFEARLRERDAEAAEVLGRSLCATFLDPSSDAALEAELKLTHNAQLSVGLVSVALAESLREVGVEPALLAGHSYGELPALCAGGAFSFTELIALSAERGRLLGGAAARAPGSMLALASDPARAAALIEGLPGPLVLANLNGPKQVVASGTLEGIAALEARCREVRVGATRLKTACAFHSPLMAPVQGEWDAFLATRSAAFSAPRGVLSSVDAAPYAESGAAVASALSRQVVSPVRWIETVEALHARGGRLFLEVGPQRVLSGLCQRILSGKDHLSLAFDRHCPKQTPRASLLDLLARLASHGVPLAWERFSLGHERGLVGARPAPGGELARRYFAQARGVVEAFFAQQQAALGALQAHAPEEGERVLASLLETNRELADELLATQAAGLAYFGGSAAALPALPALPSLSLSLSTPAGAASEAPSDPGVASESAGATGAGVAAILQAEICKLTGFPPEVVKPTSEFEGDLGLSSINLAELWAAFLPRYPALEGHEGELLGLRCVGDLSRLVKRILELEASVEAAALPAEPRASEPEAPAAINPLAVFREHLRDRFQVEEQELNAGADFEEDFGFDVFSRRSAISSLLGDDPTCRLLGRELLGARSLGAVEALLQRVNPSFRDEERGATTLRRYLQAFQPRPLEPGPDAPGPLPERLLIVGAPAWIERLSPALQEAGVALEALALAPGGWESEGRRVGWDDASALRARLADAPRDWLLCALDAPLDSSSPERGLGSLGWAEEVEQAALAAFALAKAAPAPAQSLLLVGAASHSPAWGAARGLWRALACEWQETRAGAAWFAAEPQPAQVLALLRARTQGPRSELDLRWGPEGLSRGELVEAPLAGAEDAAGGLALERGDLVLATGGGSGITAELALSLVEGYGVSIVACGRTPEVDQAPHADLGLGELDEAGQAELRRRLYEEAGGTLAPAQLAARYREVVRQRELAATRARVEAAGGRFHYRALDLADPAALSAGLAAIEAELGPIAGLIHGAGQVSDARLERKEAADLRRVLAAKAGALGALYRALRAAPLRFAVLLGSLSAYTGRAGQTDYGAANEVLRAAAAAWGAEVAYPVRAISWGVWTEAGLARGFVVQRMAELGLSGVGNAAGRAAFLRELEAAPPSEHEVLLASASNLEFVRREAGP